MDAKKLLLMLDSATARLVVEDLLRTADSGDLNLYNLEWAEILGLAEAIAEEQSA